MRINYCLNDNHTSGHLDGISVPTQREFVQFIKKEMPWVARGWGVGGGGGMGTGGGTD